MSLEFNVLVVGGGIVGLASALAMAQRGYTVAIIDAGSLKRIPPVLILVFMLLIMLHKCFYNN